MTKEQMLEQITKEVKQGKKWPCEKCAFKWGCTGFHVGKFNCKVIKSDVVQVKNKDDVFLKCELGVYRHMQQEQEAEKCLEPLEEPSEPLQRE